MKQKHAAVLKRSKDAEKALEEAKTEEDIKTVEAEITEIEKESGEIEIEKKTIEAEITELETELEEVKERSTSSKENTNTQQRRIKRYESFTSERIIKKWGILSAFRCKRVL